MSSPSTDIAEVWNLETLAQIEAKRFYWVCRGQLTDERRALLEAAKKRVAP